MVAIIWILLSNQFPESELAIYTRPFEGAHTIYINFTSIIRMEVCVSLFSKYVNRHKSTMVTFTILRSHKLKKLKIS